MNVLASTYLNSREYRLVVSEDYPEGPFSIQKFGKVNDQDQWITISTVDHGYQLAMATWSAVLIADRAGRL